MKKPLPGDGIVLRSTLLTLLAFLVAGIGLFAFTYQTTADRAAREAMTRLNQLLDTVQSTLSIACFLKDEALAQDVATGLMRNPEVLQVTIQADETRLVDKRRPDAGDGRALGETLPALERDVMSPFTPDKKVGFIRLSPNPALIATQRHEAIERAAEQLLWQLLVVSSAIGAALIFFVARPISRLSARLHTMDPLAGERLSIPAGHESTEIGRLVNDINHLADRLMLTIRESREAGQAAEAASAAKSQFIAHLSREMRTPLMIIRQIAQLGARQGSSSLDQDHFRRIDGAGAQLQATLDDVLDFSRLEAGQLTLENHPCRLAELIDEALATVKERAAAKGIQLVGRLSPTLPSWIIGDAQRIRQILVALLAHAVRRSLHGSIVLTVLHVEDELWFSIRDEGVGLTEEEIAALFRAFSTDDRMPGAPSGATRLTLPIAMNLASLMGGTIQAISTPWQGSTFTLRLPARVAEAPD